MRWQITFGLLAMSAALVACKSSYQAPPNAVLQVFGVPEVDSIKVTIVGDVQNPGVYWVARAVSLAALPEVAGGWSGKGEFGASPTKARVTNPQRKRDQRTYSIKTMSREEKEAVRFCDGDVITFPRVLF